MKKVLVIIGATGTGKTELAMNIADIVPSQIISIDSTMVYKGMDIGTAKPSKAELLRYPHALVDILEPNMNFSVADCLSAVPNLINQAHAAGKIAILVGGTMMYHYMLQYGMHDFPELSAQVRVQVQSEYESYGLEQQWRRLCLADAVYANKLSSSDKQRIHRALELIDSGFLPSVYLAKLKSKAVLSDYEVQHICLRLEPRSALYDRLNLRFEHMVRDGFVSEVEHLMSLFPGLEKTASFRSIGYKQIAQYLLGNLTKEQAFLEAKTATRRFAKRQITWSKRWQNHAFYTEYSRGLAANVCEKLLESKM